MGNQNLATRYGFSLIFLLSLAFTYAAVTINGQYVEKKVLGFTDPNTNHLYRVIHFEVEPMVTSSTHRSIIQVSRLKLNETNIRAPNERPENVQSIKFHPTLEDVDLHCSPSHCYMVVVLRRTKQNVELYAWQRVQFDLMAKRDSFALPKSVKIFNIADEFYVAIAQEQLHLKQSKLNQELEEPIRFIGCAILKFQKNYVDKIKYHQFIKLPFNPRFVSQFTTHDNSLGYNGSQQVDNYYLVFSTSPDWHQQGAGRSSTFLWSPLNKYFWPYRLPRGITVQNAQRPASSSQIVVFPQNMPKVNLTTDFAAQTELCFNQLQRILSDRDLNSRRLIDSGRSIWRQSSILQSNQPSRLANMTSQVIVHGNVTVRGSFIESPQVSLLGAHNLSPVVSGPIPVVASRILSESMRSMSPALVNQKIKQAQYKLRYIREKLDRAVPAKLASGTLSELNSPLKLYGNIQAKEIFLRGVFNSDVLLNGMPFRQLERELVSLRGSQSIVQQVHFQGKVFADVLEINGIINGKYRLIDAVNIHAREPQVIEIPVSGSYPIDFQTLVTPEVKLLHNQTFNMVQLNDFITRDNRTQFVHGYKMIKRLSMDRLNVVPGTILNDYDLNTVAKNVIRLRDPLALRRLIFGNNNFQRPIYANKLTVNNVINQQINLSLLIQDSVKTYDTNVQQIYGSKIFQNGISVNQLITRGSLNGLLVDDIFNTNQPLYPYPQSSPHTNLITGNFQIGFGNITGNLNASLVNNIDIRRRAIRRAPKGQAGPAPQYIRGHKTFFRPLRVINNVTLLETDQISQLAALNISAGYPLINGVDLKELSANLARQMQQPPMIFIDNLEIEGNLEVAIMNNGSLSQASFGNSSYCPIDAIRSKLIMAGDTSQTIEIPIYIDSLRAKSVTLEPGALNGMSLPQDFILRNSRTPETVQGTKTFQHLSVEPSTGIHSNNWHSRPQAINIGPGANINNLNFMELQTFMQHESKQNSTGEQIFDTINVRGNVFAKRINGHMWPEDVLLKSLGTVSGPPESPQSHNRIYSPLVFLESSHLIVDNQLVLRGPIRLEGRLNGVNLTEFSLRSATYGDKDLFYNGRPLRNKSFLGGITVNGEVLAQGLIDGINLNEMQNRVVTIKPNTGRLPSITAPKMFMSDIVFDAPVFVNYIGDAPVNRYLERIQFQPDGHTISVGGKKIITGALRINKNLFIDGLINGVDYATLRNKAVPLSGPQDELRFNKTMVVEGDVFMDNLHVDPMNGTIDGVRLSSLKPIDAGNRLILNQPQYNNPAPTSTYSARSMTLADQPQITQSNPNSINPIQRRPISIRYETGSNSQIVPQAKRFARDAVYGEHLTFLRGQIVPLNLMSFSPYSDVVVGFIEAPHQGLEGYIPPASDLLHFEHLTDDLRPYVVLDQVDFSHNPQLTHHLSAVVSKVPSGRNTTSVRSSIGGRPHELLSELPIDHPNSAVFVSDVDDRALFLLISQDHVITKHNYYMCPPGQQIPRPQHPDLLESHKLDGSVHVYLFHILQNSSSLSAAYFDLYHTIDTPEIDSFAKFQYHGSTYVTAISRATQRIYLLILRGFLGFQVVSYTESPKLETVDVVFAPDGRPTLVIHQTDGTSRIMEAVVI